MYIPVEKLKWMYETMVKIRYFEETIASIYAEGKSPIFNIGHGTIPGEMHLAVGQEPTAVGMCVHLQSQDTVTGTHRPHHHAIAKGVNLRKMAAEIFGKETGLCKGKGGHMHLFDPAVKFSCGGIVAADLPHAVGAALAAKMNGMSSVAVAFIGEGAANSGAFHESLNLAALWKLPFILVVEDNHYGISVSKSRSTSIDSNASRASSYGIPGMYVKNNDLLKMYHVCEEAVCRARRCEGPTLIEIETYRYHGHCPADKEVYRDKEEVQELRLRDPIERLKKHLLKENLAIPDEISVLEINAQNEVDDAISFARNSAYPNPKAALEDLFEPETTESNTPAQHLFSK